MKIDYNKRAFLEKELAFEEVFNHENRARVLGNLVEKVEAYSQLPMEKLAVFFEENAESCEDDRTRKKFHNASRFCRHLLIEATRSRHAAWGENQLHRSVTPLLVQGVYLKDLNLAWENTRMQADGILLSEHGIFLLEAKYRGKNTVLEYQKVFNDLRTKHCVLKNLLDMKLTNVHTKALLENVHYMVYDPCQTIQFDIQSSQLFLAKSRDDLCAQIEACTPVIRPTPEEIEVIAKILRGSDQKRPLNWRTAAYDFPRGLNDLIWALVLAESFTESTSSSQASYEEPSEEEEKASSLEPDEEEGKGAQISNKKITAWKIVGGTAVAMLAIAAVKRNHNIVQGLLSSLIK